MGEQARALTLEQAIPLAARELQPSSKGKDVGEVQPFRILGRGAAIMRGLFAGVRFPVVDREELIAKAGGSHRLITVTSPDGATLAYSLMDLLEAWPDLDSFFPMQSAESVSKQFARLEIRRKRARKSSPLLQIRGKHLTEILHDSATAPSRPGRSMQFAGFPSSPGTGRTLLTALGHKEGLELLTALPRDSATIMLRWIKWLLDYICELEREAALAGAVRAEEQANAADAAATAALEATRDVGAARTNEAAQQAVDETCAATGQALAAAEGAANAAAEACGHAGSVPDDVEAQSACSRARAAAARAQAAADRAQGACTRARDIASIVLVTICGHVNEEDPCCDDDVNGAHVEVANLDYPEIPAGATSTDGNGNYCVTGRFGPSSRVGCANVLVTMDSGSGWGNIVQSKQITVCSMSPGHVDFSFDAPGIE